MTHAASPAPGGVAPPGTGAPSGEVVPPQILPVPFPEDGQDGDDAGDCGCECECVVLVPGAHGLAVVVQEEGPRKGDLSLSNGRLPVKFDPDVDVIRPAQSYSPVTVLAIETVGPRTPVSLISGAIRLARTWYPAVVRPGPSEPYGTGRRVDAEAVSPLKDDFVGLATQERTGVEGAPWFHSLEGPGEDAIQVETSATDRSSSGRGLEWPFGDGNFERPPFGEQDPPPKPPELIPASVGKWDQFLQHLWVPGEEDGASAATIADSVENPTMSARDEVQHPPGSEQTHSDTPSRPAGPALTPAFGAAQRLTLVMPNMPLGSGGTLPVAAPMGSAGAQRVVPQRRQGFVSAAGPIVGWGTAASPPQALDDQQSGISRDTRAPGLSAGLQGIVQAASRIPSAPAGGRSLSEFNLPGAAPSGAAPGVALPQGPSGLGGPRGITGPEGDKYGATHLPTSAGWLASAASKKVIEQADRADVKSDPGPGEPKLPPHIRRQRRQAEKQQRRAKRFTDRETRREEKNQKRDAQRQRRPGYKTQQENKIKRKTKQANEKFKKAAKAYRRSKNPNLSEKERKRQRGIHDKAVAEGAAKVKEAEEAGISIGIVKKGSFGAVQPVGPKDPAKQDPQVKKDQDTLKKGRAETTAFQKRGRLDEIEERVDELAKTATDPDASDKEQAEAAGHLQWLVESPDPRWDVDEIGKEGEEAGEQSGSPEGREAGQGAKRKAGQLKGKIRRKLMEALAEFLRRKNKIQQHPSVQGGVTGWNSSPTARPILFQEGAPSQDAAAPPGHSSAASTPHETSPIQLAPPGTGGGGATPSQEEDDEPDPCAGCECDPPCISPAECRCTPKPKAAPPPKKKVDGEPEPFDPIKGKWGFRPQKSLAGTELETEEPPGAGKAGLGAWPYGDGGVAMPPGVLARESYPEAAIPVPNPVYFPPGAREPDFDNEMEELRRRIKRLRTKIKKWIASLDPLAHKELIALLNWADDQIKKLREEADSVHSQSADYFSPPGREVVNADGEDADRVRGALRIFERFRRERGKSPGFDEKRERGRSVITFSDPEAYREFKNILRGIHSGLRSSVPESFEVKGPPDSAAAAARSRRERELTPGRAAIRWRLSKLEYFLRLAKVGIDTVGVGGDAEVIQYILTMSALMRLQKDPSLIIKRSMYDERELAFKHRVGLLPYLPRGEPFLNKFMREFPDWAKAAAGIAKDEAMALFEFAKAYYLHPQETVMAISVVLAELGMDPTSLPLAMAAEARELFASAQQGDKRALIKLILLVASLISIARLWKFVRKRLRRWRKLAPRRELAKQLERIMREGSPELRRRARMLRTQYKKRLEKIEELKRRLREKGASLEELADASFNARAELRLAERDYIPEEFRHLFETSDIGAPDTLEDLVKFHMVRNKITREAALERIIESATRSSPDIDRVLLYKRFPGED